MASSRERAKAFASFIRRGVRHCASNTEGEATRTQTHSARDVATLSRFRLYRNSMPSGASAQLDAVIE